MLSQVAELVSSSNYSIRLDESIATNRCAGDFERSRVEEAWPVAAGVPLYGIAEQLERPTRSVAVHAEDVIRPDRCRICPLDGPKVSITIDVVGRSEL